jgi:hypothetical protein
MNNKRKMKKKKEMGLLVCSQAQSRDRQASLQEDLVTAQKRATDAF